MHVGWFVEELRRREFGQPTGCGHVIVPELPTEAVGLQLAV